MASFILPKLVLCWDTTWFLVQIITACQLKIQSPVPTSIFARACTPSTRSYQSKRANSAKSKQTGICGKYNLGTVCLQIEYVSTSNPCIYRVLSRKAAHEKVSSSFTVLIHLLRAFSAARHRASSTKCSKLRCFLSSIRSISLEVSFGTNQISFLFSIYNIKSPKGKHSWLINFIVHQISSLF